MDHQNLFNFLTKDASNTRGSRDSVDNLGVYKKGVRLGRPGTFRYGSLLDKRLRPLESPSSMKGVRKLRGRNDSLASGRLKGWEK